MLSRDYLVESITYDPETGEMWWNNRPRHHFDSDHQMKAWNARWAGKSCGSPGSHGYMGVQLGGKLHLAHRLAWLYMTGEMPPRFIDHVNHIRMDNRWSNLRDVEKLENHKNMSRSKANTSGFTGVTWDKNRSRWIAHITVNRKFKSLGRFLNREDALAERKKAEKQYGFHVNHGEVSHV